LATTTKTRSESINDLDREALLANVPEIGDESPLAAQLVADTKRRISLSGTKFKAPKTTRVITVANQKGGVGKTTSTVNLAAALAQSGLRVLVIDCDPQGNASTALALEHRAGTPSIYEVLIGELPLANVVQACADQAGLFGVPATLDLAGSEIELVSLVSRETRLRDAIAELRRSHSNRFDYILIDCPPSLGLLTVNAFVAGHEVLIPIQCEYYALEGLSQLKNTIRLISENLNPDIEISAILLTMFDSRTNLAQQVVAEVREHFSSETLDTVIPRAVRISEAPGYGQTVMTYDPRSTGALAYLAAAKELNDRYVRKEAKK